MLDIADRSSCRSLRWMAMLMLVLFVQGIPQRQPFVFKPMPKAFKPKPTSLSSRAEPRISGISFEKSIERSPSGTDVLIAQTGSKRVLNELSSFEAR